MAIYLDPRKVSNAVDTTGASVRTHPAPTSAPDADTPPETATHRPARRRVPLPLPGVSTPNIALAGLQLLIGYEWLVSGVDKMLLGTFPSAMGDLLTAAINGGRLPGFFAALLQALVVPQAALFGVLIEWGEMLAGLGLLAAGSVTLLRPLAERYLNLRAAILFSLGANLLDRLAPVAAVGAGLLGLSFFLLDGVPLPWFAPSIAYGGAIDTGLFLAAASVILVVGQLLPRHRVR